MNAILMMAMCDECLRLYFFNVSAYTIVKRLFPEAHESYHKEKIQKIHSNPMLFMTYLDSSARQRLYKDAIDMYLQSAKERVFPKPFDPQAFEDEIAAFTEDFYSDENNL
jgi:hypothetical protein